LGKKLRKKSQTGAGPRSAQKDDAVFKALANADRRRILDLVRQAPQTTGEICSAFSRLDRCTVIMHLKSLESAELILSKKKGRHRWNYLNVEPIQRIYQRWIGQYAQPAAALLTQLKQQLEDVDS
jgi:DNA-binding transcriptional ArsR family regulator